MHGLAGPASCGHERRILQSHVFGAEPDAQTGADFTFVQVSDSHVGFNKGAYSDVVGTFQLAVSRINALRPRRGSCSIP